MNKKPFSELSFSEKIIAAVATLVMFIIPFGLWATHGFDSLFDYFGILALAVAVLMAVFKTIGILKGEGDKRQLVILYIALFYLVACVFGELTHLFGTSDNGMFLLVFIGLLFLYGFMGEG